MNPSKHKMSVLAQIFKLIPRNLIPKLANEHGVDKQSRSFSPGSHVLALIFGQLSHALGLNDICDTLQNHSGVLTTLRDATPPSRNGFSHANRTRSQYGRRFVLESFGAFGKNQSWFPPAGAAVLRHPPAVQPDNQCR